MSYSSLIFLSAQTGNDQSAHQWENAPSNCDIGVHWVGVRFIYEKHRATRILKDVDQSQNTLS